MKLILTTLALSLACLACSPSQDDAASDNNKSPNQTSQDELLPKLFHACVNKSIADTCSFKKLDNIFSGACQTKLQLDENKLLCIPDNIFLSTKIEAEATIQSMRKEDVTRAKENIANRKSEIARWEENLV